MATVRICVCGDESVGKSSLIVSLVKDRFVAHRIQSVLPPITLPPPPPPAPDPQVITTVVDTSARPQDRAALGREIRKCNVILLLYASSYSFERVALFWMPYLRSLGVSVPVVLCCSKADLQPAGRPEEMQPVMDEFKEVDSCIRASAREAFNVVEAFWLCQRAVLHPIAPLFDHKTGRLKPKCAAALCRIFFLSDEDQDGLLGDREMARLQSQCFGKALPPEELEAIKRAIMVPAEGAEGGVAAAAAAARGDGLGGGGGGAGPSRYSGGIDIDGFLRMHEMYVRRGRPETVWGVLRKYRYNDSLGLEDKFLHPRLNVAEFASAELSPAGYRFFVDLFLLFDRDNDGGLNDGELAALFRPTPGIPSLWADSGFPATTVRDEAGHVTLQGWLAQWSMTTFLEPQTTLEYLAYLGFGDPDERDPTSAAIKVTRPRRRGRHQTGGRQRMMRPARGAATIDRSVVHCYLVGSPGSGKSSLLDAFLGRPFNPLHTPTITPRRAVNTVELPGGRQVYLILEELGRLETAILDNQARLDGCDLVCLAYDSSDPESFGHLVELRARHRPALDDVPAVYAALKADRDKTMQNAERQPDAYAAALGVPAPRHVSVVWGDSIGELFVALAEAATTGLPLLVGSEGVGECGAEGGRVGLGSGPDRTSLYFAAGAVACATVAALVIWRRGGGVMGPS